MYEHKSRPRHRESGREEGRQRNKFQAVYLLPTIKVLFVSLSISSSGREADISPFYFVSCRQHQKPKPMLSETGTLNIHRCPSKQLHLMYLPDAKGPSGTWRSISGTSCQSSASPSPRARGDTTTPTFARNEPSVEKEMRGN